MSYRGFEGSDRLANLSGRRGRSLHEADANAYPFLRPPRVAVLKEASPSFFAMRRPAMRFRGLLRGADLGR
jgi:hypothetical protein